MIDIHSHVIFDIDQGPSSLEQSVRMIYEAEEVGIKAIIATPQYNELNFNIQKVFDHFNELKLKIECCNVKLILGYEISTDSASFKNISNLKALTLGNSKYILLEFPNTGLPAYCFIAMKKLIQQGYQPILAHPESNINFQNNISLLLSFKELGCLIQVDAASTIGIFSEKIRNFTRLLLFSDIVDFVASNARASFGYSEWFLKSYKKVSQWIGGEKADKLFSSNADVIMDIDIRSGIS